MKKLFLMLAVISLTFGAYAQEQNSESIKKVVVARLDIKPEKVDQFLELAEKIVEQTRKEQGCITYILYKSCFTPENEFVFYEEYKDQKALDFHNASTYLKEFLSVTAPMLAGAPKVEVF